MASLATALAACAALAAAVSPAGGAPASRATLEGRAVLPAATFAAGPPSGTLLGTTPVNGITPPFRAQPVQGFSAVIDNHDGTFLAMPDNGFGSIENSADFELRVYRIRPRLATATGGAGRIAVLGNLRLRDPGHRISFPIVNAFSRSRVLTGADFDIESMQRTPDGTLWFGDEFGPVLLHTDRHGVVLEAPIPLPDADRPGTEVRSSQSPFSEESSTLRVMNAVRAQARANGDTSTLVVSPSADLIADGDPATGAADRIDPPAGSGLAKASSEIIDVASLQAAGFPVVPYTVNDTASMNRLLKLGVKGLISDRSDLLYAAVAAYDANRDGIPGDYLGADGLIDRTKFDAEGHRGSRNLRPENTLPAMEAGLDQLVTTLETDTGLTRDGTLVLFHDPYVEAAKCRRSDGAPYTSDQDMLIHELTAAQIQSRFVCDKVFRGDTQLNDRALSPVAAAFAAASGLPDPYTVPTLQNLFDFTDFYVSYYRDGAGRTAPDAERRWRNAARVHFNIETKLNPRTDKDPLGNVFAARTAGPAQFARTLGSAIADNGLTGRADVQSFDFRTLLLVQRDFPEIPTVYLFGDFPKYADPTIAGSDDGTNLQPQSGAPGATTPWMAGLRWPYRSTALANPFRAATSGGFEGMALTRDGRTLLPLLEKPLVGDPAGLLRINAFDLAQRRYTGLRYSYALDARGTNIGDFVMYSSTQGLVLERDASQGDLNGFKTVQQITLGAQGAPVAKAALVDLMGIADPSGISNRGASPGDVGLGTRFAFPFTTIEDVVVLGPRRIGVINDNNFPFSLGRHLGTGAPDDTEFIQLGLDEALDLKG